MPSSWHCAKCIKNGFFVQDDKQRQRQQFQDYEDQYYSDDDNDKVIDESENDSSMNYNDSSQLLDSLSYSEKQIILSEFCFFPIKTINYYKLAIHYKFQSIFYF